MDQERRQRQTKSMERVMESHEKMTKRFVEVERRRVDLEKEV